MEFFQGRGRCSEDEEVDMIGDMDKLPYNPSSSSSSNGRWGSQLYEDKEKHKIWVSGESAARFSYDHQSGSSEVNPKNEFNKRGDSDDGVGGGEEEEEVVCIEREHMFDKVVTPSDVGKLNRLVIPKQHAEKYFPLDSSANEKGLLLNFEDRSGKPWRFRYSYWNSSQSYVMTKGWSRFVKEKKLYAGDIVSFQRGAGESVKDRLYIDWRRRSDVQDPATLPPLPLLHPLSLPRSATWGGLILPPNMPMPMPMSVPRGDMVWQRMHYGHIPPHHHLHNRLECNGYNTGPSPMFYLRPSSPQQIGGAQQAPTVFNSAPAVHGKASAKRLRLFGVNLECPTPEYQFLDPPAAPQILPPSLPPLELSLYNTSNTSSSHHSENASMSLDLDM